MNHAEFIFPGAINKLEEVLSDSSFENILLIRGNQSFNKSGAKEALAPIYKKYAITEFSDFSVNPKLEEAQIGFDLLKKNTSSVIIAVGGGSVIDTAKIIKYLAIQENQINSMIPFVAIPTTAGTGSEATHFAVVYINEIKHSYAFNALLPTVALVDSNLLNGQTEYQMAVSGFDAFAQGIESFWSIHSTEKSIQYAGRAIKLIWENLEAAIKGDKKARINVTLGSNWAGKAINITKTTAPHALSYGFTSKFGLPHGHAVALFLPFFIKYHRTLSHETCNDKRGIQFINNQLDRIAIIMETNINDLGSKVKSFLNNLNIETDFKRLNISLEAFNSTIEKFSYERLSNNPGKIEPHVFKTIYNFNITPIAT